MFLLVDLFVLGLSSVLHCSMRAPCEWISASL